MASPVRPSGSRLIHQPPNTAVQGRPRPPRAVAPTTPRPPNPHLADYSQTNRLRTQIGVQARNNPSLYGTLVGTVNGLLQRGGFGISPASHQSVMRNLREVSQGTMPQSTAHFRESQSFARDALASYSQGRFIQGEVERFGATINLIGGIGMSAVEGAQRLLGQ
jgi:hypothetical protein